MPANCGHESFPQPPNTHAPVWRYMNFVKYVSLLDTGSLYFSRADLLGDPFEGSYPNIHSELMRTSLRSAAKDTEIDIEKIMRAFSSNALKMPQATFISCWHMNDNESAAMWSLYSDTDNSVAITMPYEDLAKCLPDEILLGEINYIDYRNEPLKRSGNLFDPFMHKRNSFEHEKEIRAILWEPEILAAGLDAPPGKLVALPLRTLPVDVRVSPTANSWFLDLVTAVTEKYDLTWKVGRSDLLGKPNFLS